MLNLTKFLKEHPHLIPESGAFPREETRVYNRAHIEKTCIECYGLSSIETGA